MNDLQDLTQTMKELINIIKAPPVNQIQQRKANEPFGAFTIPITINIPTGTGTTVLVPGAVPYFIVQGYWEAIIVDYQDPQRTMMLDEFLVKCNRLQLADLPVDPTNTYLKLFKNDFPFVPYLSNFPISQADNEVTTWLHPDEERFNAVGFPQPIQNGDIIKLAIANMYTSDLVFNIVIKGHFIMRDV